MTVLRVVLDTNVLLSGIAYPSSIPGKILTAWRRAGSMWCCPNTSSTNCAAFCPGSRIGTVFRGGYP